MLYKMTYQNRKPIGNSGNNITKQANRIQTYDFLCVVVLQDGIGTVAILYINLNYYQVH